MPWCGQNPRFQLLDLHAQQFTLQPVSRAPPCDELSQYRLTFKVFVNPGMGRRVGVVLRNTGGYLANVFEVCITRLIPLRLDLNFAWLLRGACPSDIGSAESRRSCNPPLPGL